jgi:serine/threonine-protein kinase ULK/ATG1
MSKQVEINCKNYTNFIKIGSGTYGIVYRAKDKNNGLYVAIKEIIKERFDNPQEILEREVEIMKKIKNENSVNLKEVIETNDFFYIIMDYCEYNLQTYLNQKRNDSLSIKEIKQILIQLNNTLKLMLKENIIHRDLKPNNILISLEKLDKNIIKLSDYGSSKEINNTMSIAGTPLIMSPEVLNGEEDLSKTDLWSLGIIIYYMYFKEYPYNGKNEVLLLKDINSGKQLKIIDNQELNDLMKNLLKINPNERLSWEEYFNHKFFKEENNDNIPFFNFKCQKHSQNLYSYCQNCK